MDDVTFDYDAVACQDCGREINPSSAEYLAGGTIPCRACLDARYGLDDEEDADFASAGPQSFKDTEQPVYLREKKYMRNCNSCGNWYEDGKGMKTIFGARLCPTCKSRMGIGGLLFRI